MSSLRNALRRTVGYVAGATMGAGAGVSLMRILDKASEAEVTKVMRDFANSVVPLLTDMVQKGRSLDFNCGDCKRFGHGYMLRDEVWADAVKDGEDGEDLLLCLACCEQRIGRPIMATDLVNVPINEPLFYAWNHWPSKDDPGASRHHEPEQPDHE